MKPKKRISKKESIKQIKKLLGEGYATEEILGAIRSKWELPDTTFYDHLKEARKEHSEEQEAIRRELMKDTIKAEKEANREYLYDKGVRAQELIEDIRRMRKQIIELEQVKISGKKIEGEIIATTQSDVTNAKRTIGQLQNSINQSLELLAKWYGYNEPEKLEVTERKVRISFKD